MAKGLAGKKTSRKACKRAGKRWVKGSKGRRGHCRKK